VSCRTLNCKAGMIDYSVVPWIGFGTNVVVLVCALVTPWQTGLVWSVHGLLLGKVGLFCVKVSTPYHNSEA